MAFRGAHLFVRSLIRHFLSAYTKFFCENVHSDTIYIVIAKQILFNFDSIAINLFLLIVTQKL